MSRIYEKRTNSGMAFTRSNASFFDMISAFDQTRIHPDDEKYATIINHMGILQQRVTQQGDKNSVATQQQYSIHTGNIGVRTSRFISMMAPFMMRRLICLVMTTIWFVEKSY
jgi:hypothetical protein